MRRASSVLPAYKGMKHLKEEGGRREGQGEGGGRKEGGGKGREGERGKEREEGGGEEGRGRRMGRNHTCTSMLAKHPDTQTHRKTDTPAHPTYL